MFKLFKKAAPIAGASAVLIAVPFTAHHEGLRLKAYLDPVGIPTICYGETENVALGTTKTKAECDALLEARLGYFAAVVDYYIQRPMSDKTHAALTSFTYNVGSKAFGNSTLVKLYNANRKIEACDQLLRWTYAKGKQLPGLVKRRQAERALCLEGLNVQS